MAAAGTKSAKLAEELADGLTGVSLDQEVLRAFDQAGGSAKPRYGQLHVCWAKSKEAAKETVAKVWPNTAITAELGQELPLPLHLEQAVEMLRSEKVDDQLPTGPDPEPYVRAIQEYADDGHTHVYAHQIGPDQEGFFRFWQDELEPRASRASGSKGPAKVA